LATPPAPYVPFEIKLGMKGYSGRVEMKGVRNEEGGGRRGTQLVLSAGERIRRRSKRMW
jgi:hypothetical protein